MARVGIATITDVSMKVKLRIMRQTESAFTMIRFKATNIMENGKMMCRTEKENKSSRMGRIMKESFFTESNLVLDTMCVIQESLKASSPMEIFMEMEFSPM